MMSYARVSTLNGEGPFWLAVTHLDHMGTEARYQQAKIIAEWVKDRTEPVILMGDFNDRPGSRVHGLLTSSETGLKDSWNVLGHEEGTESFTHHRFTGSPQETRMDWVLASPHFKILAADIIRDNADGRYPSDHFPYLVELDLKM
jgi:endonuclease/exonuclease/phosphatase family metal-dependent hydrolase